MRDSNKIQFILSVVVTSMKWRQIKEYVQLRSENVQSDEFNMKLALQINPKQRRHSHHSHRSNLSQNPEQIHHLEVTQLKRENAFLKKKLEDLRNEKRQLLLQGFGVGKPKRRALRKGLKKQKRDQVQLSLEYFFKEINNLIKEVVEVFKVYFLEEQHCQYQRKVNQIDKQHPEKPLVIKKEILFKKLERIGLDVQEKRYPLLINLFTDYYRTKTEAEKTTIAYVDSITEKTIQLNRWLIQTTKSQNQDRKQPYNSLKSIDRQQIMIQNARSQRDSLNPNIQYETLKRKTHQNLKMKRSMIVKKTH